MRNMRQAADYVADDNISSQADRQLAEDISSNWTNHMIYKKI